MATSTRRDMSTGHQALVHSATCLWPAALIFWGPGSAPGRHTHHCVQLVIALAGSVRARERRRDPWRTCQAAVVRSDAEHEIDTCGAFVVIGFIGTEQLLSAAIAAHLRSSVTIVPRSDAARWRQALGDPATLDGARVKRWVRTTVLRHGAPPMDSRVEHVIRTLRHRPLDRRATSLARLSQVAGLSPSRFAHVFVDSLGVPVRAYMRWLRLHRAARELMSGHSVTHAAHIGGFADAAHLTRTFRRTIGIPPRLLSQHSC
jgi:AraC-like DNA-binding protein